MNRRGHLSTKVPNVKLRPAPPRSLSAAAAGGSRRRKSPSPMNAMDEELLRRAMAGAEDEEASTNALRKVERPWSGVVITFTGVEDKARLSQMATELGARVELALTTSVTHVVAEGHNTAKYLYAVEHRIPVATPGWIEEAHKMWIESEEWDEEELLQAFKLKPFADLKICMSGIDDLNRRKQLIELINNNGGTYAKDLDRSCTHLISSKPTSERVQSEKLKWAIKELSTREATRRAGKTPEGEDMRIVYEEWIWDCVGYEGRWKEDGYDARKVRKTGKVIPQEVIDGSIPPVMPKRKEREEEDVDEPAVLKKRKRDTNLVNELLSTSAMIKTEVADAAGSSKRPRTPEDDSANLSWAAETKPDLGSAHEKSVDGDPRSNAPVTTRQPPKEEPPRTSVLHISRTTSFAGPSKPEASSTKPVVPTAPAIPSAHDPEADAAVPRIFEGLRFSHVIENETRGLEEALKRFGGTVVPEEERLEGEHVDYVIVRLCSTLKPQTPRQSGSTDKPATVVTECWIEACCYQQRLLSPDAKLVFRPLKAPMPVFGAAKMSIHLSGYSSEQTTFLRRLIRIIGAELSVKMTRKCTHLVCRNPSGQKYEKALEWGLQVVKETWLEAAGEHGVFSPEDDHRHVVMEDFGISALRPSSARPDEEARPAASAQVIGSSPPKLALRAQPTLLHPQKALLAGGDGIEGGDTTRIMDSVVIEPPIGAKASKTAVTGPPSRRQSGNPLSPPRLDTERRLNGADRDDSASSTSASNSPVPRTKKASQRTSSAPPPDSPGKVLPSRAQLAKSASTTILNGMESLPGASKADVTEVLRQLAEGKDAAVAGAAAKSKLSSRRSRPLSRLRTGSALSPLAHLSPASTSDGTSPLGGTGSLQASPERTFELDEGMSERQHGVQEESMRVVHLDPAAMKERRRMEEALNGFRSRR